MKKLVVERKQGAWFSIFGLTTVSVAGICLMTSPEATLAAPARLLKNHIPSAVKGLPALGRLSPEQPLQLAIGLPLRNPEALTSLLQRIYDPTSADYRHYLTPGQFTEMFGPTETEYQAVIDFVTSKNLTIAARSANRMLLEVNGTAENIEKAFQTHLNCYKHPKESRVFYAPDTEPSVVSDLAILDIAGLDDFLVPHPMGLRPAPMAAGAKPLLGSGLDGAYSGGDFRATYVPGATLTGAGQTIGLLQFDGYYASDIAAYESQNNLPAVPLQNVLLNRFKGTPGPNNNEVALDIEMAIAMAPGLSKVIVYEGTLPNTILTQMAEDNTAKQLSSSWSYTINSTTEQIFQQFAAQGQSMFQASGDAGAYSGVADSPCDDPNLTIVGGTTLRTSGPGGNWISETAWNWANSGIGTNGTGGGISTVYPLPVWQQGIKTSANQASTTMRNFPDVAMAADDVMVIYNNGSTGIFGGTSVAAPLWAGFMALVNQQAVSSGKRPVGFLNPSLYSLAKGSGYASAFHDITTGNNTNAASPARFSATAGYDLCTGWGTPAGQSLINALAGVSISPPTPVHVGMFASGNQVSLNWTGGNPPYQVEMASDLSSTNWASLGSTSNTSFSISLTNRWGFYRILAH